MVAKLVKNMGGEGAIRKADDGDCWLSELLSGDDGAAVGVEMSIGKTVADAEACDGCCCCADNDDVDDEAVGPPEGRGDDIASSSVVGAGGSSSAGAGTEISCCSCGRKVCACADVGVGKEASSTAGRTAGSISMADDVDDDDVGGGTEDSASHICSMGSCALVTGLST